MIFQFEKEKKKSVRDTYKISQNKENGSVIQSEANFHELNAKMNSTNEKQSLIEFMRELWIDIKVKKIQ